jgi:hypothetical protein
VFASFWLFLSFVTNQFTLPKPNIRIRQDKKTIDRSSIKMPSNRTGAGHLLSQNIAHAGVNLGAKRKSNQLSGEIPVVLRNK